MIKSWMLWELDKPLVIHYKKYKINGILLWWFSLSLLVGAYEQVQY